MSQESAPKGTYLFASIFLKTLPVLVSAFFGQLSGLVNSILTGHYDTADLAAVSFGFLFMMTQFSF